MLNKSNYDIKAIVGLYAVYLLNRAPVRSTTVYVFIQKKTTPNFYEKPRANFNSSSSAEKLVKMKHLPAKFDGDETGTYQ